MKKRIENAIEQLFNVSTLLTELKHRLYELTTNLEEPTYIDRLFSSPKEERPADARLSDALQLNKEQVSIKLFFNEKEIKEMPKTFKKEFRQDGCTAHVRKIKSGKDTYIYEIRYRRNGYNISVSNKNLEVAKNKFVNALKTADNNAGKNVPTTFNAFAMYYFNNFRIKKVAKRTFQVDMSRYNLYLKPYFKEKSIKQITPIECQKLIDSLNECGKGKTADEVYSLLSIILKVAISHNIITKNPLNIVFHQKHQTEHGSALKRSEEAFFITALQGNKLLPVFALALYTGLRPNELYTAKIEGPFIVAKNSKRKNGKIEYKKIPITKMLAPYIKNGLPHIPYIETLRETVRSLLPGHKLYDLRTTFYTRCKECGISDYARDEFVGHSSGTLGDTYTDLSDEYLLKEGEKFYY